MNAETPDRNKTELTQNVTRYAVLWLDAKGFKPVETEVSIGVSRGWVADVGGAIMPTQTEYINLKLIRRPPRYDFDRRDKPGYQERYREVRDEWNTDYRKLPGILTAIIEVKTSVADFQRDIKFQIAGYDTTNLRYIAMPAGLLAKEKWPTGWGILLYGSSDQIELNGGAPEPTLRCVQPSPLFNSSVEQSRRVILQLAIRRDHVSRYARLRAFQKRICIDNAERKSLTRIRQAISFVLGIAEGHSVEDAKLMSGLRVALPNHITERIDRLKEKLSP